MHAQGNNYIYPSNYSDFHPSSCRGFADCLKVQKVFILSVQCLQIDVGCFLILVNFYVYIQQCHYFAVEVFSLPFRTVDVDVGPNLSSDTHHDDLRLGSEKEDK